MTDLTVVRCGRLIDGVSDEPRSDHVLVVEDGTVTDVRPEDEGEAPDSATYIDHSDKTVVPGLVDAHVHLGGWRSLDWFDWVVEDPALGAARATNDLEALLAAGFTSVRDLGSRTGLGLKRAVAEGEIRGPRVFASGLGISQTGGFSDPDYLPQDWAMESGNGISTLADGPQECRRAARKRVRDGADVVKIWTSGSASAGTADRAEFSDEEVRTITEEAHRAGIPVASHAVGSAGVETALTNGVDTIEHGHRMNDRCLELLDEHDGVLVPTLAYSHQFATVGDEYGVDEDLVELNEDVLADGIETVRRAYEAGVPIAAGTDFCGQDLIPHGENVLEVELYVEEVGMDEMDAIRAATSVAGRTLPVADVGRLEEGTRADFVTLGADPLDDISALRTVGSVYVDGERIYEATEEGTHT